MESHDEKFLSTFTAANEKMINTNKSSDFYSINDWRGLRTQTFEYSLEDVQKIVMNGSLQEQRALSVHFFNSNSVYKRLIMYYATFLKYIGLLTPNPSFGNDLSKSYIQKRYYNALTFVDSLHLPTFMSNAFEKALKYGCYYGIVTEVDRIVNVIDLPVDHCRSNFTSAAGVDLVEFDLNYFNTIGSTNIRNAILDTYPEDVRRAYADYINDRGSQWYLIPAYHGVRFSFSDSAVPLFIDVIPAIMQYQKAVDIEQDRNLDEIRKILVQKIPHLNDGNLVFEPEEAEAMHAGAVGMLKGNKNVSVLTTYADVDTVTSKTSAEANNNGIEKMYQHVYNVTGTSSELFAATGSSTLPYSIKTDLALVMSVSHKMDLIITHLLNEKFANSNINFAYEILPISWYNDKEYIDETFKLAQSGYSYLLPALGCGMTQRQFLNTKQLEDQVLKLSDLLKPLGSAYTQSAGGDGSNKKADEDKSEKTQQNEKSLDNNAGGSN